MNAAGRPNRAPAGTDEWGNANGDLLFSSYAPSAADRPGGEFDDLVQRLAPDDLLGRLCSVAAAVC